MSTLSPVTEVAGSAVTRESEASFELRFERQIAGLEGHVVEIGPGTSPHLPESSGSTWTGIEPDPRAVAVLSERLAGRVGVSVLPVRAERIPLPDGSVDVVVGSLVLCSVADPVQVLAEVRRVLRPGGRYVFAEHVAPAPGTALRAVLRAITPCHRLLVGGCHPARDTGPSIARAGFAEVDVHRSLLPGPLGVGLPHISGVAHERQGSGLERVQALREAGGR
jgi:SAM-dependent methyltransferase